MALATRAAAAALVLLLAQLVADVRSDQRVVSSEVFSCLPGAPPPMAAATGRRIQQNPDTLPTQPEDDIPLNVARPADIKCFQKLSVLIELAPEQQGAPATFRLRCIGSPVCPCPCNYLSDPGCTCRDLKSVLEIKVDHSAFTATFATDPTGEKYTWNAAELVTPTAPGQSCTASGSGFCCACERTPENDPLWPSQQTRGFLACPEQNNGSAATVHSYRSEGPMFSATEILDSGRLKLATTVDLFYFTRMNEMSQEVMTASATARGAPLNVSLNGAVSVQYVTNFTLPEWRGKMLMTAADPGQDLGRARWMLVDKQYVGRTNMCNMVATQLQPFLEQPDRCRRARQQCLRYQLGRLYNQDQQLAAAGQVPQHVFSRWSNNAKRVTFTEDKSDTSRPRKLIMTVPLSSVSYAPIFLRVEIKDSAVDFVGRIPGGALQDLNFCATNGNSCGQPRLGARRWYLHGNLSNPSSTIGKYKVTMACSVPVVDQGVLEYSARPKEVVDLGRIPVLFIGDSFGTPDWFQQMTDGNCTLVLNDEKNTQLQKVAVPFVTGEDEDEDSSFAEYKGTAADPCAACSAAGTACLSANNCPSQLAALFTPISVGIAAVAAILLFLFWDNIFGGDVTLVESGPAPSKRRHGQDNSAE